MKVTLVATGARPWELWFGYWGLSYVVNDEILYDTFCNFRVLAKKLKRAQIDIATLSTVVISHDHWDHIGGLWKFLERRPGVKVYLPSSAQQATKDKVVSHGGILCDQAGHKDLGNGVILADAVCGKFRGQPVAEQYLLLNANGGPIIAVGCSHAGILAIVQSAKALCKSDIYGVIGGLHLMHASATDIEDCAGKLKGEGVNMIAPTHCTGWKAERIFRRMFAQGFVVSKEGQTLDL